ncbi:hypothetical protein SDC9_131637 [bioreactor metagenome]|uniref:Uncharacterized protein n=1 Tax=bioreactor metagenome TaxID=1076179 RepID=A0A645D5H3_9ZZZZ
MKNAPFVSLNLSAALAVFSFRFGANFKYFFFCFQDLFFFDLFGFALGIVIEFLYGVLRLCHLCFRNIAAVSITNEETGEQTQDADDCVEPPHMMFLRSIKKM